MRRHFDTIDSTNDAARAWARDSIEPAPHGAFVCANEQTGGRGRQGRNWVSPRGKGVYLSMVWRPKIAPHHVGQLTIVTALGAARAMEQLGTPPIDTKWPNDLLLNRKKIGGILCEAEIKNGGVEFIVAGVGINANFEPDDFPERPVFPATSLFCETGKEWSVQELREACIKALQKEFTRYQNGDWPAQRAEFIARCAIIGEPVKVRDTVQTYSGIASGIDENGFLIVQTPDGNRCIISGEVSFHS